MDSWPPALLDFMRASGNAMSRRVWERAYDDAGALEARAAGAGPLLRPNGPGNVENKKAWCIAK